MSMISSTLLYYICIPNFTPVHLLSLSINYSLPVPFLFIIWLVVAHLCFIIHTVWFIYGYINYISYGWYHSWFCTPLVVYTYDYITHMVILYIFHDDIHIFTIQFMVVIFTSILQMVVPHFSGMRSFLVLISNNILIMQRYLYRCKHYIYSSILMYIMNLLLSVLVFYLFLRCKDRELGLEEGLPPQIWP